ncbi:unnamed protein product [Gordionus sp. m RMFG-2023]|uniref:mesoderm induction early response protein 1-like n=1 Tax=Gordionus sp. m RMFG-2023 TaxID=3053472 RepID=UPI0030DE3149
MNENKDKDDDDYDISDEYENSEDDEQTLIEEENLETENPIENELSDLANEAELPIEQLLAKYGYMNNNNNIEHNSFGKLEETDDSYNTTSSEDESSFSKQISKQYEKKAENSPQYVKRKHEDSPEKSIEAIDMKRNKKTTLQNQPDIINQIVNHKVEMVEKPFKGSPPKSPTRPTSVTNNNKSSYTKYLLLNPEKNQITNNHSDNITIKEDDGKESSSDEDYVPIEYWKKQIQVGKEYQADLNVLGDDTVERLEHQADLLWDPKNIPENKVKTFLRDVNCYLVQAQKCSTLTNPKIPIIERTKSKNATTNQAEVDEGLLTHSNLPKSCTVHDNANALKILMKCMYDSESALREIKHDSSDLNEKSREWNEDDCLKFEEGLQMFSKDFYKIQQNNLPHKNVNELVDFYYFWKKSERHDSFAAIYRGDKKKYTFNPNTTDYMDKLVDDTVKGSNELIDSQSINNEKDTLITPLHHKALNNCSNVIDSHDFQGENEGNQ